MSTSYKIVTLDLSVAHATATRGEVIPPRTAVRELTVLSFQPGTDLQLFLGERPDPIPVLANGLQISWDECDEENDGIFFTNVAQSGVTVAVYLGFAAQVSAK